MEYKNGALSTACHTLRSYGTEDNSLAAEAKAVQSRELLTGNPLGARQKPL